MQAIKPRVKLILWGSAGIPVDMLMTHTLNIHRSIDSEIESFEIACTHVQEHCL